MPIYSYSCPNCEHSVEKFVRKMDDEIFVCPQCYGAIMKKVWSIPAPAVWACSKGSL